MLPKLAAALHTTVDALLGCSSVITDYDKRYDREEYYWGLKPNRLCYEIMKILPPIKPYRVLDIGCGEGKDAVFFAKCGYAVTAFDISEQGIEKAKKLAAYNQVEARFFRRIFMITAPTPRGMRAKGIRGIRENCLDIIMTGCFICAGKKCLTATAAVRRISIVWIR